MVWKKLLNRSYQILCYIYVLCPVHAIYECHMLYTRDIQDLIIINVNIYAGESL